MHKCTYLVYIYVHDDIGKVTYIHRLRLDPHTLKTPRQKEPVLFGSNKRHYIAYRGGSSKAELLSTRRRVAFLHAFFCQLPAASAAVVTQGRVRARNKGHREVAERAKPLSRTHTHPPARPACWSPLQRSRHLHHPMAYFCTRERAKSNLCSHKNKAATASPRSNTLLPRHPWTHFPRRSSLRRDPTLPFGKRAPRMLPPLVLLPVSNSPVNSILNQGRPG